MKKITALLLFILLSCSGIAAQNDYMTTRIDSMKTRLQQPFETEKDLLYSYLKLAHAYSYVDPAESIAWSHKGATLAQEKNNPYWTAELYLMLGMTFQSVSQQDSALYYFEKSLEQQKIAVEEGTEDKEENDYLTIRLLASLGDIDDIQGNSGAALEKYLQAMEVAERINDPEEVVMMCEHIALVYFKMSNHLQAEAYYLKMKQLSKELDDSAMIARANVGLVPILLARGENHEALEVGEEAYRYFLSHPHISDQRRMDAAMRLTEIWMAIPDYDKAMEYAQACVAHARETNSPPYMASALYTLSSVYLKQKKYKECEQAALDALAADSTNIYINSILYANIAQANIWRGNGEKAIEYFSKTMDANRAFSNRNFQAALSEMEVKYETEKKEILIGELRKEKQLITWLGVAGIAILVLVLVMFILLWRWTVQKKHVAEKQQQIAEQQVKQLEQEKQLVATQAILDGEVAERTRLARDLHDGLGSMLTGVKLNLEGVKNGISPKNDEMERFDHALGMLNESMIELRRVAHHLMPDSLSRFGLKVALDDFCNNFPTIDFVYFGDEERFDSKMEVMIYRIIHELINNALKHSGASQILVQVMKEPDYIAFIVRDNGSGFDTSLETRGMGLPNIRDRVASYGGRMEIDSKPEEGTEINIEFRFE